MQIIYRLWAVLLLVGGIAGGAFAHDKGLKTEITPLMSFEERLEGLSEGRYDVIACGILATSRSSKLIFNPLSWAKACISS